MYYVIHIETDQRSPAEANQLPFHQTVWLSITCAMCITLRLAVGTQDAYSTDNPITDRLRVQKQTDECESNRPRCTLHFAGGPVSLCTVQVLQNKELIVQLADIRN